MQNFIIEFCGGLIFLYIEIISISSIGTVTEEGATEGQAKATANTQEAATAGAAAGNEIIANLLSKLENTYFFPRCFIC